jgi:hypothetical protein
MNIPRYPSVYTIEPWSTEADLKECFLLNDELSGKRKQYWKDYYEKHKDAKNKEALKRYHARKILKNKKQK